jgi:hypothetical protein
LEGRPQTFSEKPHGRHCGSWRAAATANDMKQSQSFRELDKARSIWVPTLMDPPAELMSSVDGSVATKPNHPLRISGCDASCHATASSTPAIAASNLSPQPRLHRGCTVAAPPAPPGPHQADMATEGVELGRRKPRTLTPAVMCGRKNSSKTTPMGAIEATCVAYHSPSNGDRR